MASPQEEQGQVLTRSWIICFIFVFKICSAYLIIFLAHNNTIHGTDTVQDDLVTHAADMTNPLHQDILQNGLVTNHSP